MNNVFLTLQKVIKLIIISDVNNNYKLPHLLKHKLEQEGQLPLSMRGSDKLKKFITEI